jgi:hypothetical protein
VDQEPIFRFSIHSTIRDEQQLCAALPRVIPHIHQKSIVGLSNPRRSNHKFKVEVLAHRDLIGAKAHSITTPEFIGGFTDIAEDLNRTAENNSALRGNFMTRIAVHNTEGESDLN